MAPSLALLALPLAMRAGADRILQIPDVHADDELMRRALALVEPILPQDKLVFTGDLVDRGPRPRECYELTEQLAQQHNVTRLIGNHEWVNLMGVDSSSIFAPYVPKEDLDSFGGWAARIRAFSREGDLGRLIREGFQVIALEALPSDPRSRTLFVHGGVSAETFRRYGSVEAMQAAGKRMLLDDDLSTALLDEILQTRHLAQGSEAEVCRELEEILRAARAERLVLGHTPTHLMGGRLTAPLMRCGGRLLFSDVAMSRWMGGGAASALTIETDDATGLLRRIFFQHGRGEVTQVPILPALNEYRAEL